MIKNYETNYHTFNKVLQKINFKKKYIEKLKNKIKVLRKVCNENYKKFNTNLYLKKNTNFLVAYILEIYFLKSNTFLQVINSKGALKFFCSAGCFLFKGKSKKARTQVLKKMVTVLLKKLKFLEKRPTALHLKNVGFKKNWILKKLKKKTFLKTIFGFNSYSHNGCRRKKIRRKR